MYRLLAILFLAAVTLAVFSCKKTPLIEETAPPAGEEPVDYAATLEKTREKLQDSKNINNITSAIRAYQSDMGKAPTNLAELVKFDYISSIPEAPEGSRFVYEEKRANLRVVRLSRAQQSALAQQKMAGELRNKAAEKAQ